jgi:hypothetical protein
MWRKAIIIPLLKAKKPASELSSYRPISLMSTLAKTMEKMVGARLNWYLETQISYQQHKQALGDTAQQINKLLCLVRKLKIL